jgi:hypothetical protein
VRLLAAAATAAVRPHSQTSQTIEIQQRNALTQRGPGHHFPDAFSLSMLQKPLLFDFGLQTWHVKVCPRHRARGHASWSGVGTAQGRGGVGGR